MVVVFGLNFSTGFFYAWLYLNTKIGAYSYNLFHHKGLSVLLYLAGCYLKIELLQLVGVILFSHAAMDRIFGYGLKYEKGFKYTHLGEVGK